MVVVHNRRQKYMTNSLFDIAAHAFGVEKYIYILREIRTLYTHTHIHTHTFIHEFFNKVIMTIVIYGIIGL